MSQFFNQIGNSFQGILGGIGQAAGGVFGLMTSPLALIGDICGMFGGQQSGRWMSQPGDQGACGCGSGSYGPSGNYLHEANQNARLSNLEQRLRYDEAMTNYRLARGGM